MLNLADLAEYWAHTSEQRKAARDFKTSTLCAKRSFSALQIIAARYAPRFAELSNDHAIADYRKLSAWITKTATGEF